MFSVPAELESRGGDRYCPRMRTHARGIFPNRALISLSLALAALVGCRALSVRCRTDDRLIATREQSRLGMDALQAGRGDEARIRLEHALKSSPQDAEAHHHLAQVLRYQGKLDEAIRHMSTAVRLSGDDPDWTVELGELYAATGNIAEASACADRALSRGGQLSGAWVLRGDVLRANQRTDEALAAYHRAITGDNPPHAVLLRVAEIYHGQGRYQRELATLRRYAANAPVQDQPRDLDLRQGLALQLLQRHEEALVKFAAAEASLGDNADLLTRAAESHLALGQVGVAQRKIQRAAELQPGHPQLTMLASLVRQIQGENSPLRR